MDSSKHQFISSYGDYRQTWKDQIGRKLYLEDLHHNELPDYKLQESILMLDRCYWIASIDSATVLHGYWTPTVASPKTSSGSKDPKYQLHIVSPDSRNSQ
jgi:hypothetical protein